MSESLGDWSFLLENKYALMLLQPQGENNNKLMARENDAQIKLITAWSPQTPHSEIVTIPILQSKTRPWM